MQEAWRFEKLTPHAVGDVMTQGKRSIDPERMPRCSSGLSEIETTKLDTSAPRKTAVLPIETEVRTCLRLAVLLYMTNVAVGTRIDKVKEETKDVAERIGEGEEKAAGADGTE